MFQPPSRNPQLRELPVTIPEPWWERVALLNQIAADDRYSPYHRIGTLAYVTRQLTHHDGGAAAVDPKFVAAFVRRAGRLALSLTPQEKNDVHALRLSDGRRLDTVTIDLLKSSIDTFNTYDLVSSFAGYARLGLSDATLSARFNSSICAQIADFDLGNLSKIAWSYARLGTHSTETMEQLAQMIIRRADGGFSNDLAAIAWAFATIGFKNEPLLQKIAAESIAAKESFNGQNFANIMWAFGKLDHRDHHLFHHLTEALKDRLDCLTPQGLANVTWALARTEFRSESFLNLVARRAQQEISSFRPQEVASLAWSFGVLRFRDDELLAAIARRTTETISAFDTQGLANIIWAMTSLARRDDTLAAALRAEVDRRGEALLLRERSNIAWAFSLFHPEHVAAIYPPESLALPQSPEIWMQGYVALLVAGAIKPTDEYPDAERHSAINVYPPLNLFEKKAKEFLTTVFPAPEFTVLSHVIVATVATDFVITGRNKKMVVECDGHFYHTLAGPNGGGLKGADLIQDKLLRLHGYDIFHLSEREFFASDRTALAARLHRYFN